MKMKSSWKRKLIHTIVTIDQLMLVLEFSYENNIEAEHALINTSENEQLLSAPNCTKNSS